jgi:hypothetical protein
LHRRLDHAGKRRERLRSPDRLRALRHVALDHPEPKPTLGSFIRRLDPRILEEPQQIASGVVPAELVQQPLVVGIHQPTWPQMPRHRLAQRVAGTLKARELAAVVVLMPKLEPFFFSSFVSRA